MMWSSRRLIDESVLEMTSDCWAVAEVLVSVRGPLALLLSLPLAVVGLRCGSCAEVKSGFSRD